MDEPEVEPHAPVTPAPEPASVAPERQAFLATYHISIWDEPLPTYVCILCLPGMHEDRQGTLELVTAHLRRVHDADAIPSPNVDTLLALRAESDAALAREAEAASEAPPPPKETSDGGGTAVPGADVSPGT